MEKWRNILKIIEFASNDFQLNPFQEDYLGFINLSVDQFDKESELRAALKDFVFMYNLHPNAIDYILKTEGLVMHECPDEGEVIIYNIEG